MQLIADMWLYSDPRMQLELMPEGEHMKRLQNHALMSMLVALVVVPLFPLAVITVWNMLKPRRVLTGAFKDELTYTTSSRENCEKLDKGGANLHSKPPAAVEDFMRIERDASGAYSLQCAPPQPSLLSDAD
jgi:hypothetical protein